MIDVHNPAVVAIAVIAAVGALAAFSVLLEWRKPRR